MVVVSQADVVDPISLALQARARQVAIEEERDRDRRRRQGELYAVLGKAPSLDPEHLLALLIATWERMPEELIRVPWESPTAACPTETVQEVMAIGAAVADVFAVYEEGSQGKEAP